MAFTRKEKQLLHDDCFAVLREDDIYTEVQSKNTGHCWSIFKNMFEYGGRITLYHKHTKETKYYHKHRICMNVAEAVEHTIIIFWNSRECWKTVQEVKKEHLKFMA